MALITISQSMGSGDPAIPRRVAETLNLELYDDQKLKEKALEMGIQTKDLNGFNEKAPGFFDRLLSTKPEFYLNLMKSVVYEVSRDGNGVIIGHGSQILLRNFGCALHVLIHSPVMERIQTIMKHKGLSRESAEKLIRKSDNERKGFFRFAFNLAWNDPALYDVMINTEKMGADIAAKLIADAARSDEIKACSLSALETIEKLSQERLIHAALIKNDVSLSMLYLEVPTKGVAVIRGITDSSGEQERILSIIKEIHGVSEVVSEIVVSDSYSG